MGRVASSSVPRRRRATARRSRRDEQHVEPLDIRGVEREHERVVVGDRPPEHQPPPLFERRARHVDVARKELAHGRRTGLSGGRGARWARRRGWINSLAIGVAVGSSRRVSSRRRTSLRGTQRCRRSRASRRSCVPRRREPARRSVRISSTSVRLPCERGTITDSYSRSRSASLAFTFAQYGHPPVRRASDPSSPSDTRQTCKEVRWSVRGPRTGGIRI